jgi:hypothetical protein
VFLKECFRLSLLTASFPIHYNQGLTFWSPAAL